MEERARVAWLERVAVGDLDALGELLTSYSAPLRAGLLRRMPSRLARHCGLDDILQRAYVDVVRSAPQLQFACPAAFYRWLEVIVANRLTDAIRAREREPRAATPAPASFASKAQSLIEFVAGSESTPSRALQRRESLTRLQIALARLKDEYREVVTARFLNDESAADIAARLGKSREAVHQLCHRGLSALRKLLPPESRGR